MYLDFCLQHIHHIALDIIFNYPHLSQIGRKTEITTPLYTKGPKIANGGVQHFLPPSLLLYVFC